jgi:hypothetical protein
MGKGPSRKKREEAWLRTVQEQSREFTVHGFPVTGFEDKWLLGHNRKLMSVPESIVERQKTNKRGQAVECRDIEQIKHMLVQMMDSVKTAQFAGFKGSCSIDEAMEFIMEQVQMGNRVKLFPKEQYKKMQWVYVHSNVAGILSVCLCVSLSHSVAEIVSVCLCVSLSSTQSPKHLLCHPFFHRKWPDSARGTHPRDADAHLACCMPRKYSLDLEYIHMPEAQNQEEGLRTIPVCHCWDRWLGAPRAGIDMEVAARSQSNKVGVQRHWADVAPQSHISTHLVILGTWSGFSGV